MGLVDGRGLEIHLGDKCSQKKVYEEFLQMSQGAVLQGETEIPRRILRFLGLRQDGSWQQRGCRETLGLARREEGPLKN